MTVLVRSFSDRIDDHPALGAMAALHGHVERKLYAAIKGGRRFTGDLAVSFYRQFGISAKTLDGIHRQLKAKLKSVSELAKIQAKDLDHGITAKRKQIAKIQRKMRGSKEDRTGLRCALHQHKRRLAVMETRLAEAKRRIDAPTICFGSRKLFGAQCRLDESGYVDHQAWLKDWRSARSGQFFIEGDALQSSGNAFAKLSPCGDGTFDLELRLPEALADFAEHGGLRGGAKIRWIDLSGLRFSHGADDLRAALAAQLPLSFRFEHRGDGTWTVSVVFRQEFEDGDADLAGGALGVDLNADHVALTLADGCGNPTATGRIDLATYGKTSAQRQDAIRKAAAEIANLAADLDVPVVAEKLDFANKRAELETMEGAKRARMLSSFAYNAFGTATERACARRSVRLVRINPAYTSLIGRVKFAPRYGLSVHAAAALSIARRAMGLSERLPASCGVTLADGDRVTLARPARNARRHVWSSWSGLASGLRAVHAGRRRARRKARSGGARGREISGAAATETGLSAASSSSGRRNSSRAAGSAA